MLREAERERTAFESLAGYILQNSLRAGLVEGVEEYAYCGGIVLGYPSLDPKQVRFWESFWLAYEGVASEA